MFPTWIVICAVLAAHAPGGSTESAPRRDPLALPPDPCRIAVFAPDFDALALEAALAPEGALNAQRWPIAGWWLVDTPTDAQSNDAALALVNRIASNSRIPFVSPVYVGLDGGPVFATRDLLVGFERSTSAEDAESVLATLPGFSIEEREFGRMERAYKLRSHSHDARDVLAAARELARRDDVLFAEPDMIFTGRGDSIPNDPLFPQCWGLHNVGQSGGTWDVDVDAPEAWDRTMGTPWTLIVVIDSGVDLAHPDLWATMIPGADVTSDGPGSGAPINPFDNHGTLVAGCAIATSNNGIGLSGIAPGCRAAPARAFITVLNDGTWTTQTSWTIDSLAFAEAIGARVTNNSNVYGFSSQVIDQKYLQTWNAGIVHFACAGNAGGPVAYPASIPVVNAVGSIQRNGVLSTFSNFGPELDFVAPGEEILTTDRAGPLGWNPGDYLQSSGTSFAAPFAAGIAALIACVDPTLTAPEIEAVMRQSATDLGVVGQDAIYGHGLVNAWHAVQQSCVAPTNYCMTSPNSVGPGAVMTYAGSTSLIANDLVLVCGGCPPNTAGRFYLGSATTFAPLGNGFRCIGGPTIRLPVLEANLFGDFVQAFDAQALPAASMLSPGMTRYFQLWYRNPAAGGAGYNLSDGLRVHFCL
jgi:subtilisin family serine protease